MPAVPILPEAPAYKPNLPKLPQKGETDEAKQYRQMGIAYTLPVALITPIILLTAAGWWLDQRFGRKSAFTLGGAVLGIIVGFVNMIRMANKLSD